jgi:hypothetical protein
MSVAWILLLKPRGFSRTLCYSSSSSSSSVKRLPRSVSIRGPKIWKSEGVKSGMLRGWARIRGQQTHSTRTTASMCLQHTIAETSWYYRRTRSRTGQVDTCYYYKPSIITTIIIHIHNKILFCKVTYNSKYSKLQFEIPPRGEYQRHFYYNETSLYPSF